MIIAWLGKAGVTFGQVSKQLYVEWPYSWTGLIHQGNVAALYPHFALQWYNLNAVPLSFTETWWFPYEMSPEDNEHKEARHSSTKYKQSWMMQDGIEAFTHETSVYSVADTFDECQPHSKATYQIMHAAGEDNVNGSKTSFAQRTNPVTYRIPPGIYCSFRHNKLASPLTRRHRLLWNSANCWYESLPDAQECQNQYDMLGVPLSLVLDAVCLFLLHHMFTHQRRCLATVTSTSSTNDCFCFSGDNVINWEQNLVSRW